MDEQKKLVSAVSTTLKKRIELQTSVITEKQLKVCPTPMALTFFLHLSYYLHLYSWFHA